MCRDEKSLVLASALCNTAPALEQSRLDIARRNLFGEVFVARGSILPAGHAGTEAGAQGQDSTVADRLFAELDNRAVNSAPYAWIAQVLGVHMIGTEAWVQVGSASEPLCSVMLHLSPHATADQALAALRAWSGTPLAERDSVVHVMHVA
jgi:hypothetical protein